MTLREVGMDEKPVGTDVNQVEITSLSHIVGQAQVREVLRVSIDSYFQHRANNPDIGRFQCFLL